MKEADLGNAVEDVRRGHLPRRVFMQRLAAAGIPAPLASLMLMHAGVAAAQAVPAYKPTRRGGGGALRLLYWQAPTLLNPHFGTGTKDLDASRLFYEPLARYDPDAQLVPVLAAEIPSRQNGGIATDGRSTTWKLKRNVTWHDGKPFTADDVVFNWRYAADPATAATTGGVYEVVASAEKIDPHTVRFVFRKPTPLWSSAGTLQMIPQHLFAPYQGAKSREAPYNLKPVGTGPYRFVEFKPGDIVKGELNPAYHLPNRPHFDTIEIKGGGDAASAARAVLQTREFDFAWNLQVEDEVLRRMETGGKGRVAINPGGDTEFIQFNMADPSVEIDGERASTKTRHPVLTDPAVREALSLLLDRKSVHAFVYGRGGVPTANILNNPAQFTSPNIKAGFNLDKANALLDAAGWKRGAGGVREKGGRRLTLVFQTSINPVRQKVQAIFKQACSKAGIELAIKTVPAAVFFSSDEGNPDTFGKFYADVQMYLFTRVPDPGRFMQQWSGTEVSNKANKWQGLNRGRWVNAEYDALFSAQEGELDPVKRAALFVRMNDVICNDHAVVPVVYRPVVNGVANNVVAPSSGWDLPLSALHDWYREG